MYICRWMKMDITCNIIYLHEFQLQLDIILFLFFLKVKSQRKVILVTLFYSFLKNYNTSAIHILMVVFIIFKLCKLNINIWTAKKSTKTILRHYMWPALWKWVRCWQLKDWVICMAGKNPPATVIWYMS